MDFIQTLAEIDRSILLFLNGINSPFFDNFMFLISDRWVWIPFYLSLVFVMAKYYKKDFLFLFPALILCIVFADQVSSGFLKGFIERPRPTREEDLLPLLTIVNNFSGSAMNGFVS